MLNLFRRLAGDDAGATAIEYSLIGALVSVAIIAALGLYADSVSVLLQQAMDAISAALSGSGTSA